MLVFDGKVITIFIVLERQIIKGAKPFQIVWQIHWKKMFEIKTARNRNKRWSLVQKKTKWKIYRLRWRTRQKKPSLTG